MSSRITTYRRHRHRSVRPSEVRDRDIADCRAAARALVESLAREIHLPRGVPSAPGQPGYASWRTATRGCCTTSWTCWLKKGGGGK